MLGQDKKIQQAKMSNSKSRLDLCNYLQAVIDRTENDYIREGLNSLKNIIESFPPCSDEKALVLDRKIRFIVDRFRTQSFQYNNYLSENSQDAMLSAAQYELGNKEIFDLIIPVLENHLANRNRLMGETIKSKKELKSLSDYERVTYYNDIKELENLEKRWDVDGTILEFTIRYRKLFYEQQILQGLHDRLFEKGKTDKQNRESIIAQLEQIDREIEKNKINQSIVAREMANHKDLRGMMEDLNVEKFVADTQYGQENFLKIYSKMAGMVKDLAKKRDNTDSVVTEIKNEYDQARKNNNPQSKQQKSEYHDMFEEHDLKGKQSQITETIQEKSKEKNKI